MGVTIYDVAKRAKVSPSWVSWALRNHPRAQEIRQETRDRIHQAAKEIGYRPKTSAATIRTGFNPSTLAMICRGSDTPIGQLYLISRLNSFRYGVRVYYDYDLDNTFNDILDNQLKYMLCSSGIQETRRKVAEFGKKNGLRAVFTSQGTRLEYPAFITDEIDIFSEMVCRLFALGHHRIAFYCAPHKYFSTEQRHKGYLKGLKKCKLPVNNELVICEDFSKERLLDFVVQKKPTAFCCIDGTVALHVENCLIRHGIRIPQDISIFTTCGNVAEVSLGIVPITFFSDPGCGLIDDAIDYLLERRNDFAFDNNNQHLYPGKFHDGESIAKVPKHQNLKILPDLFI